MLHEQRPSATHWPSSALTLGLALQVWSAPTVHVPAGPRRPVAQDVNQPVEQVQVLTVWLLVGAPPAGSGRTAIWKVAGSTAAETAAADLATGRRAERGRGRCIPCRSHHQRWHTRL